MGSNITVRTVRLADAELTYQLEHKAVKNLNLRIRKDGSVYVSAPSHVSTERIDAFVLSKESFIVNARQRFREREQYQPQPKQYISGESFSILGRTLRLKVSQAQKNSISSDGIYLFLQIIDTDDYQKKHRMVTRYLDQQCREVFGALLKEVYPVFEKYGVAYPTLRIRTMETRWGSCLPHKGIITLNKQLLEMPRSCIEYVVTHEYCHFIHPNHSKEFYAFLTMLMPDWKQRKDELERYILN